MTRETPHARVDYPHFTTITTRWNDNDPYGHVNNVVYYEWFDTAINQYLIGQGVLDIESSRIVGLVVHTRCSYFAPVAFPDVVQAGVRVTSLGNSSVTYEVGIFREGGLVAVAQGQFVHVYVDVDSRRPIALTTTLRNCLAPLHKSISA